MWWCQETYISYHLLHALYISQSPAISSIHLVIRRWQIKLQFSYFRFKHPNIFIFFNFAILFDNTFYANLKEVCSIKYLHNHEPVSLLQHLLYSMYHQYAEIYTVLTNLFKVWSVDILNTSSDIILPYSYWSGTQSVIYTMYFYIIFHTNPLGEFCLHLQDFTFYSKISAK